MTQLTPYVAVIECYERNTFCPDDVERYIDPDGRLFIQSVKLFAGSLPQMKR